MADGYGNSGLRDLGEGVVVIDDTPRTAEALAEYKKRHPQARITAMLRFNMAGTPKQILVNFEEKG